LFVLNELRAKEEATEAAKAGGQATKKGGAKGARSKKQTAPDEGSGQGNFF
jgi:hypothetical protein